MEKTRTLFGKPLNPNVPRSSNGTSDPPAMPRIVSETRMSLGLAGAELGGQLHGVAEQVSVLLDRFPRVQPDPQQRLSFQSLAVLLGQRLLHRHRATHRAGDGHEAGHDPVPVCLISRPPEARRAPRVTTLLTCS